MKPVILIGAGGHGTVLLDALRCLDAEIIGVCDPSLPVGEKAPLGTVVLGGDDAVLDYPADEVLLVNGVGSVGHTKARCGVYEKFIKDGYKFASVIHPSVIMAVDTHISDGVQIMAGAVIQTGAHIASNSIINTNASVDHHCIIGSHVHIAPNATLSGSVKVGNGAHIGTGAKIKQGVEIGENAIVGMGVVVLADVPPEKVLHPATSLVWTG